MGKVDDADVNFAPFATTGRALANRADKEIFAVRTAQNSFVLFAIQSEARMLKGLPSLALRRRMLLCGRLERFLRLTIPIVDEEETAAVKSIAF